MKDIQSDKTYSIVMTGLVMCLIMVATFVIRIPIPMTQGYVHLGDTMIFLGVLILGRNKGTIAAGFGSALADLIAGYAAFAPWTLIVKAAMAFVTGLVLEHEQKKGHISYETDKKKSVPGMVLAMVAGGLVMVAGYYVVESFMYNSWVVALASIPANIGQFAVGTVLAMLLSSALYKTPARKYFTIK
ncbi:MAG: ECF transporter S component [Eubacterium sp.]|jgi:uncharacterized membrane protein